MTEIKNGAGLTFTAERSATVNALNGFQYTISKGDKVTIGNPNAQSNYPVKIKPRKGRVTDIMVDQAICTVIFALAEDSE